LSVENSKEETLREIFARVQEVLQSRGKTHGEATEAHRRLGTVWSVLLSNWHGEEIPSLPPQLVIHMMAALKLCRASGRLDVFDNPLDSIGYEVLSILARQEEFGADAWTDVESL